MAKVKKRHRTLPQIDEDDVEESGPKRGNKLLSAEEVLGRMKSASDIELFIKILAYGRSGTGKTAFASTLPKPIFYVDLGDKGTDTIRHLSDEEVRIFPVHDWNDIESVYWFLKDGGYKQFPTVVLDTITQMQNKYGMPEVKVREGRHPSDPMTTPLWGALSGLMKEWTDYFNDLPMNVCFLAQDRRDNSNDDTDYDDEDLLPEFGPQLMPSVAKSVNAAVNFIGQTFIKKVTKQKNGKIIRRAEYRMRLGPHPLYLTKTRKPPQFKVPDSIKNPSYEKIMAIARGEAPQDGEE